MSERKSVAVFGGGIAGLTAAHELSRRGHRVHLFESGPELGGFFRSDRLHDSSHIPTEYSWHGFGPWYHNVFDVLRQIPFDAEASIYDKGLSRPIDFGLAPDEGTAQFNDGKWWVPVSKMFRMRGLDSLRWGWLMFKTWSAGKRSLRHYSTILAADAWRPYISRLAWKTWCACFGPWIGSDWTNVSLHQTGEFFRKQLMTQPAHQHRADAEGPAWKQGANTGWLLLRGPSSECWFNKWESYLHSLGVAIHKQSALQRILYDGEQITGAELSTGQTIHADEYILAINPFMAADILDKTPELAKLDQLNSFRPLVQRGPHIQVSFRIAFSEPIRWPKPRMAIIVADSEFNLTLFAQEQAWLNDVDLGEGVQSLWTGTACAATVPGRVYGLPIERCTKEQFLEEIKTQLYDCGGLDKLIRAANGGRCLKSFPVMRWEVWHEWKFSSDGIGSPAPKWVNTTKTQAYQPTAGTPVPNLHLAGAHTQTEADVWSIEAAAESGRRAAQRIDSSISVIPQYRPSWLRLLQRLDDVCYAIGAPHVVDVMIVLLLIVAVGLIVWSVL